VQVYIGEFRVNGLFVAPRLPLRFVDGSPHQEDTATWRALVHGHSSPGQSIFIPTGGRLATTNCLQLSTSAARMLPRSGAGERFRAVTFFGCPGRRRRGRPMPTG
jgi:hypothetical protein